MKLLTKGGEEINRIYGGTGLGLSVSRKIVLAMGGNLTVQSKLSKGSEFSFSIDLKISRDTKDASGGKRQILSQRSLNGPLKVLIVDDSKLNPLIIQKYIELWEWEFKIAHIGLEAVEVVKNDNFDIVLMDLYMPEMDGLKAIRAILK